jgi:hypothetical protein
MRHIPEISLILACAAGAAAQPVIVALDMDPSRPGIQATVDVPVGTTVVPGIAVYIYDLSGTHSIQSIGFIGGLDRGISLGHSPVPSAHQGSVASIVGHLGSPVNPANTGFVFPAHQPGFAGPEVQYLELNASAPAPIATAPLAPVFTADVQLSGAAARDVYRIALLDLVTVWRGGTGGAFSPSAVEFLTTGGDSVPDRTISIAGPDADVPQPVPPAAFLVDYVDGGNPGFGQTGGGRIRVGHGCYANCDGSTTPPILNVGDFTCYLQLFGAGDLYANCDGSWAPPVLNVGDFTCFLQRFAQGCN